MVRNQVPGTKDLRVLKNHDTLFHLSYKKVVFFEETGVVMGSLGTIKMSKLKILTGNRVSSSITKGLGRDL